MFVEIKELFFKYKNAKRNTIADFNLEIEQGEVISIFGKSGSGKSTMLRIISGLEIPDIGYIKIDDKVMVDKEQFIAPENRGVGMVFQDYSLFPHMTVEKNIEFGLKNMKKDEKKKRVDEVLSLVDMMEYKKRYPYELSGGQQQRIAIARAVAPRPSILLLDEPFSNLDKELQESIREQIKNIIKQCGITCIFVTHDRDDCRAMADRIVILKEGVIEEIIKNDNLY
ncbi:ABC transporter ATP-binding protein [Oceanirhabdus sp. W0125-5]|uniref:ABC transporter ATP-binding protein n=1 Tax=Oceanirhabdus sp. W0125-5 TaxID=2999116 RepID=UPI0022F2F321|nr:ABC transporter ATP-binding protein [Oceanirhabdus sp. W0125-5]WBW96881.1 ABC transporter ATP-binding protein [Oceanirhabdus sp. W0125-5]